MCNKSACHNVYNLNTSLHLTPWHVNEEGDNDIITGLEGLEKTAMRVSGYNLTLIDGRMCVYHLSPITSQ